MTDTKQARVSISLPAVMKAEMDAAIEAGEFASQSDYVRHHIRKARHDVSDAALAAAIKQGLEEAQRGEGRDAFEFLDELRTKYERLTRADNNSTPAK